MRATIERGRVHFAFDPDESTPLEWTSIERGENHRVDRIEPRNRSNLFTLRFCQQRVSEDETRFAFQIFIFPRFLSVETGSPQIARSITGRRK